MKGQNRFSKQTRARGAWDSRRGEGVIRDRVIGQYRGQHKAAVESPDQQDRFHRGDAVPLRPKTRTRAGLGPMAACAGCGRTKDLWEENNGQGLSKNGQRFCCKPCAEGDACRCADMDSEKGMELSGTLRGQNLGPAQRATRGHNKHR